EDDARRDDARLRGLDQQPGQAAALRRLRGALGTGRRKGGLGAHATAPFVSGPFSVDTAVPAAAVMIRSLVASARSSTSTTRPWFITAIRLQIHSSSSSSEEAARTAMPCAAARSINS